MIKWESKVNKFLNENESVFIVVDNQKSDIFAWFRLFRNNT